MDNQLTARRLSAALGRKITPDDIEAVVNDFVMLKTGETVSLLAGNSAYVGGGRYFKNGKAWDPDAEGVSPRWT